MHKKKTLLCPYCKGTATFNDNYNLIKWGVNCVYGSSTIIRNFDTEVEAQRSIDEWCYGDGRLKCRLFLLGQTKCRDCYKGDDELLEMFIEMEEKTVAKQTYYCKCGETFKKSSTAQDTGYRIDDYSPQHECYGCPFIEPVTDGWGATLSVKTHECRASAEKVNYTTTASMSLDSDCVAHVYTLDLAWLDCFINFYLDTKGCGRSVTDRDPDKLEKAFRNSSLSQGRRSYSFEFEKNKQGRAARKIVHDEFFDEEGEAFQLGCGHPDERVRVLQMIVTAKEIAVESAECADNEIFEIDSDTARESDDMAKLELLAPPQQPLEDAPAIPRTITDVSAEIRFYKAQTVAHIIEIGKRLIEAKAMLEHGQWGDWLKNEVEISHRTANNFMAIAEQYSNSQPVANLSYTNLITLLALPTEERDDFIEAPHMVDGVEKTVDEMSKRELQRVIKERDDAIKQAEQATSLKERISENYAKLEKISIEHSQKSINLSNKNQELEDDNQRLQAKVKKLESQPIEIGVQQPSDAEMASMRTAIRAEVIKELALPETYLAKKGVEEATSLFIDSVSGSVSNGLMLAMRLEERSAAKMMEAYISTLVQYTQQLRERLNLMKAVDRNVKDGAGDVDW